MMRKSLRLIGLAVAWYVASTQVSFAVDFRDFDAKTLAALRAEYAGRPFVLAFWSIHCEPCREEMGQWGPLQRRYPQVPILLVATDRRSERAVLAKLLSRYDLKGVQTWAYADEFDERVRFGVDRSWRGELPRTYLFDAVHHAEARSGPANLAWIEPWLSRQSAGNLRSPVEKTVPGGK
jgi:thiol-disulfide isomerase/thioredoxin